MLSDALCAQQEHNKQSQAQPQLMDGGGRGSSPQPDVLGCAAGQVDRRSAMDVYRAMTVL